MPKVCSFCNYRKLEGVNLTTTVAVNELFLLNIIKHLFSFPKAIQGRFTFTLYFKTHLELKKKNLITVGNTAAIFSISIIFQIILFETYLPTAYFL